MRKPYPYEILCVSSLEKVLPASGRAGYRYEKGSMLQNERFHFQVAVKLTMDDKAMVIPKIVSPISENVNLFRVELSPMEMMFEPCCDRGDTNFLTTVPSLMPDRLEAMPDYGLTLVPLQWRCIWVTVESTMEKPLSAGQYPIEIRLENDGKEVAKTTFELTVHHAALPQQELIYTTWIHLDSLIHYYGVEAFSEAHWELIEKTMRFASRNGVNMVLTPCFTPPLDTAVNGERETTQLVDVMRNDGVYSFGFEKLERFIRMCQGCGITRFEIAHLFTQWGAKAASKIMADVDGEQKRIFGWDTPTDSPEYAAFLGCYLPQLTAFLTELGVRDACYFHISDEPTDAHLEAYQTASDILRPLVKGFPIMDALSHYELYEKGLMDVPVCGSNALELFAEKGVSPLWTYYCGFGVDYLSIRSLSVPSARNRIYGYQLYRYDVAGFLHWGFNFYSTRFSLYPVDPYRMTDGNGFCYSGDCFMCYPGADGEPVTSIHSEVFFDALQDLRALRALEKRIGRNKVIAMIDESIGSPLTMYEYPKDDQWLLNMREKINALLAGGEA